MLVLAVALYYVFFFKTYSEENVLADADHIVVLDVKRIIRTAIWNYITTPSQWKLGSILKKSDEVEWKDMVKIPDYIFVFHVKDQPANAWYAVFETDDPEDFLKGLQRYEFKQSSEGPEYYSVKHQMQFIQSGDRVLLSSFSVNSGYLRETASRLFEKKQNANRDQLQKAISAAGHLGWYYWGNEWIAQGWGALQFDKNNIEIHSSITLQEPVALSNHPFRYAESALISIGFVQPPASLYQRLSNRTRDEVSKTIGFNIDSVLLPQNLSYQIEVAGIKQRIDSAISYSYDEQFNQVANVLITKADEPELNLSIEGAGLGAITDYWVRNNILDSTEQGWWFTALPLAKTYYSQIDDRTAKIESPGYKSPTRNADMNALFFAEFNTAKMPAEILGYLPVDMVKAIDNFQFVRLNGAIVNDRDISIDVRVQKKHNDIPLLP